MELMRFNLVRFAEFINKDDINIPNKDAPLDSSKLQSVLLLIFGIFGGIAVIIIVLAGIKLVTSQGNPEGVTKARNSIIYAAVGLGISIAAFTIVTFVTGKL